MEKLRLSQLDGEDIGAAHGSLRRQTGHKGRKLPTELADNPADIAGKAARNLPRIGGAEIPGRAPPKAGKKPLFAENRTVFKDLGELLNFGAFLAVFSVKAEFVLNAPEATPSNG
ncbi:MAG: hypothetical protein Q8O64_11295 [Sideroxyarcus sp.]|nr:hypothetical protein [Sideroxyarcus sp.]